MERLDNSDTNGVPKEIIAEVFRYYYANKQEDTDWVVLPVTNFDAYYGNNTFSKKWLAKIPNTLVVRENNHGVCRFKTA